MATSDAGLAASGISFKLSSSATNATTTTTATKRKAFGNDDDNDEDDGAGRGQGASMGTLLTHFGDGEPASKKRRGDDVALVIPLQRRVQWYPTAHDDGTAPTDTPPSAHAPDSSTVVSATTGEDAKHTTPSIEEEAMRELERAAARREQGATLVGDEEGESGAVHGSTAAVDKIPLLLRNRAPGTESEALDEATKLKIDIEQRPVESSLEDYSRTPIAQFGEAMLRGMGWQKGEAIGGVNKGLATPTQFVPRFDRRGLGATAKAPPPPGAGDEGKRKRAVRSGESRKRKEVMVAAVREDGRVRHRVDIDESLVAAERMDVREDGPCLIRRGVHEGLYGRVVSMSEAIGRVTLKLALGGHRVDVPLSDVSAVSQQEYKTRGRTATSIEGSGTNSRSSSKSSGRSHRHWLTQGIRVRIVSKSFARGAYYNHKVDVVDVTAPGECLCRDDEGRLLERVAEDMLETVVPKRTGERVVVLSGRFAGRSGELVERNSHRSRGVVRIDDEDDDLVPLSFDDMAATASK